MSKSNQLYTCIDKGGSYELLGTAVARDYISDKFTKLGSTIGAGTSRMESITVYRNSHDELLFEKDVMQIGMSWQDRVIYKDSVTGQLFHRTKEDFKNRLEVIKEV